MTARAQAEDAARDGVAPIVADLSDPVSYRNMIALAHLIGQHICAMPLEGLAKISRDGARMALLKDVPADVLRQMQLDRDTLDALESVQRQLMKIRARYGA